MPELVFFRRGEELMRFAVAQGRTIVGRDDRADIVLPDPEISRHALAVTWDGQTAKIEDLTGKGAIVGGTNVKEGPLGDGVDITVGPWRAIFRERVATEDAPSTEAGGTRTERTPVQVTGKSLPVQLRVKSGGAENVHKLAADEVTIGKDEGNDLVLGDRFISGRHLKISRHDGVFKLRDQNSTNGTFVGAVRVYDVEVPLGTTIKLGQSEVSIEVQAPKKDVGASSFEGIIGGDPSVRQLVELIERVAPSSAAVTILGESGTGKELVARALHNRSTRAHQPFIPVNCAAISKELIESELFGHEKGSFTGATNARKGAFEEADGGTLFLDEIGELPLELQAKLLRALESGEIKRVGASRPMNVDVRVVAATNRDLLGAAREGKFREDLYYRLCVVPLHLPPLRNRRGDIVAIADHFVRTFSPRGQTVKFTQAALDRLQAHHWPGNIRELRNVIHRALLLRRGPVIDATDLSFDQQVNADTGIAVPEMPAGMTLEQMLEKVERQIIESALRRYSNNRERVAKELGVARSTLFKRLKDWGLTKGDDSEG